MTISFHVYLQKSERIFFMQMKAKHDKAKSFFPGTLNTVNVEKNQEK